MGSSLLNGEEAMLSLYCMGGSKGGEPVLPSRHVRNGESPPNSARATPSTRRHHQLAQRVPHAAAAHAQGPAGHCLPLSGASITATSSPTSRGGPCRS